MAHATVGEIIDRWCGLLTPGGIVSLSPGIAQTRITPTEVEKFQSIFCHLDAHHQAFRYVDLLQSSAPELQRNTVSTVFHEIGGEECSELTAKDIPELGAGIWSAMGITLSTHIREAEFKQFEEECGAR